MDQGKDQNVNFKAGKYQNNRDDSELSPASMSNEGVNFKNDDDIKIGFDDHKMDHLKLLGNKESNGSLSANSARFSRRSAISPG